MGDATAAGRAERLRHAWGSIRERLGLRPAPPPESNTSSNVATTTALPTSTDPRELMLAQMARAFNLGFGLNSDGQATGTAGRSQTDANSTAVGEHDTEESTASSNTTAPQLPPEGSFERFLVDLQVDLREALTSPNGLTGDISNNTNQASSPVPLTAPEASSSNPIVPLTHEPSNDEHSDSMPMLEPVSDSDSEFTDDHSSSDDLEGLPGTFPSDPGPSRARDRSRHVIEDNDSDTTGVHGAADSEHDNITNGSESPPGGTGRINWWRLYRFPPIVAPRPQGAAGATSDTGSTLPSGSTSPSSPIPIAMDPTLAELPFAPPAETRSPPVVQTVIPVIVVGLQSVNTSWQQRGQSDDNDPLDVFGDGDSEAGDDDPNDDGTSNVNNRQGAEGTGRTRGRAWHSRAAEAIRNLRHGRRTRTTPTTALPGSRTFLIYVIGGYYPPNHSIVTGGPNSLDSFEALL